MNRGAATCLVAMALAMPCGLAGMTTPAAAAALTGRDVLIDINPQETNPCTGAVGDLVDDEQDGWTVVTRTDGSMLLRGHSVSRVTFLPYDPAAASYAGEETFTDVETTSAGADGMLVEHRFRLHGTDGGTIALTVALHVVTTPDGVTRVAAATSSLTCVQPG